MNKNQNNDLENKINSADTNEDSSTIDFIFPSNKKHSHTHHHTNALTDEKVQSDISDFVYLQPHSSKRKKKKRTVKTITIIAIVIASLLVLSVSAVLIFNEIGKNAMHNYNDMVIEPPTIEDIQDIKDDGKTIRYKGHTYSFNDKVTTVALLGIDTAQSEFRYPDGREIGESGQADAVYIAVIDTARDKVSVVSVSRDTMIDVNIYNTDGEFVKTDNMQLCLSYAYGDGEHTSCKNTTRSLERLFYGMQFDTYFSFNTDALITLTDSIGGIKLTSSMDFYSKQYGRTIYTGEEVVLSGEDAVYYIRSRDIEVLDSNNDRMARQKQFITALISQIIPAVKDDPTLISELYKTIDSNSTTNLTVPKMTYLANTAISYHDSDNKISFENIDGKVKKGEYAEFYTDEEDLMETMLKLFYVQVS